jgi:hypothetical protein
LIPEATRSNGTSKKPRKARLTASVGEPSTDQPREPSASVRSRTRSGRIRVFWCPTAD